MADIFMSTNADQNQGSANPKIDRPYRSKYAPIAYRLPGSIPHTLGGLRRAAGNLEGPEKIGRMAKHGPMNSPTIWSLCWMNWGLESNRECPQLTRLIHAFRFPKDLLD